MKTVDDILKNTETLENGCMIWLGAKKPSGYGNIWVNNKYRVVSRAILELLGIPKNTKNDYACHKCDNPSCVNPKHLFWGTNKQNIEDAQNKKRFPIAKHGTRSKYVSGCKCELCMSAEAEYARNRRKNAKTS